jgi:precorrin-2 dehydrogenase / sirohydrochlorin ferrochelatase
MGRRENTRGEVAGGAPEGPKWPHAPCSTHRTAGFHVKPYFPVGLDLVGVKAVVVGGGHEAADKARKLAEAGAQVTVVWPAVGAAVDALQAAGTVSWIGAPPDREHVRGARVVVLAEPDRALAQRLHTLGRTEGFWLCAVDQSEYCDWVNLAQVRAGPIRIAIGSDGGAPALSGRLREELQAGLDARFVAFAERLLALREGLEGLPSEERRRRMALALEGFRLDMVVEYPPWESAPDGEPPA